MCFQRTLWNESVEKNGERIHECTDEIEKIKGMCELYRRAHALAEPLDRDLCKSSAAAQSLQSLGREAHVIVRLWHFVGDKRRREIPRAVGLQHAKNFPRERERFFCRVKRVEEKYGIE